MAAPEWASTVVVKFTQTHEGGAAASVGGMMKRRTMLLCGALALVGVSGCGGGGSSGDTPPAQGPEVELKVGYFLDGAVSGLSYGSSAAEGMTGANGQFEYADGRPVTFRIGGIELGVVAGAPVITPLEVAGADAIDHPAVVNIVRLLMALDEDGDPSNGIQISDEARASAEGVTSVDFDVSTETFGAAGPLSEMLASLGASLPPPETALAHFRSTLEELDKSNWNEFAWSRGSWR